MALNIVFPDDIYVDSYGLQIDISKGKRNIINVDGVDYMPNYIDPKIKGNKGGNSFILALHNAQTFDEKQYDDPDIVLKILKFPTRHYPTIAEKRFLSEINALNECKKEKFANVVEVFNSGRCRFLNRSHQPIFHEWYLCYSMEYAESDLKKFLENERIDLYGRIDLCMSIANGIKELYSLGFYHRDIKPDNVFVVSNTWKIGDLGLLDKRDTENTLDKRSDLIGPRGWYSPEAMNKFLTEDKNGEFKFDCKIDHQSDIFQLGQLFWYIIQGNSPTGTVKTSDFKSNDSQLFAIIKTMLNHSKKRRFNHIDEVLLLLKPIYNKYFKV